MADRLARRIQNAIGWRSRRLINEVHDSYRAFRLNKVHKNVDTADVEPRITYPCYKSMDEFIDVDRLKSLDKYVEKRVIACLQAGQGNNFHTGDLKMKILAPSRPGATFIPLSICKSQPYNYFDLDKPELWELSEFVDDFSELMDFIDTLPFKATGRMMIIADERGKAVTAHRDHAETDLLHEFIWFRTNLEKPFFMLNQKSQEKVYVNSYSAWFDTVNQFHGSDKTGKLAISIRVDGHFSDEFKAKIPTPKCNPACTAALWACLSS